MIRDTYPVMAFSREELLMTLAAHHSAIVHCVIHFSKLPMLLIKSLRCKWIKTNIDIDTKAQDCHCSTNEASKHLVQTFVAVCQVYYVCTGPLKDAHANKISKRTPAQINLQNGAIIMKMHNVYWTDCHLSTIKDWTINSTYLALKMTSSVTKMEPVKYNAGENSATLSDNMILLNITWTQY